MAFLVKLGLQRAADVAEAGAWTKASSIQETSPSWRPVYLVVPLP